MSYICLKSGLKFACILIKDQRHVTQENFGLIDSIKGNVFVFLKEELDNRVAF